MERKSSTPKLLDPCVSKHRSHDRDSNLRSDGAGEGGLQWKVIEYNWDALTIEVS
jgi:hypothetical protein